MDSMAAPHGMMMGGMAEMDSLMGAMQALASFAPGALLAQREALRLDEDQVARLTAIQARAEAAHDSAMTAAMQHRRAFGDALARGDGLPGLAGHFEAMHWAMGQGHLAQLRGAVETRAVLTPGQRDLVGSSDHRRGTGR